MCSDACFFPFVFDRRALFANWFSSSRLRSTRLDVENGLKSNNNRPRAVSAQLKQLHVAHINKTHPFWSLTSATRRYGLAPCLPLCPHALPSTFQWFGFREVVCRQNFKEIKLESLDLVAAASLKTTQQPKFIHAIVFYLCFTSESLI